MASSTIVQILHAARTRIVAYGMAGLSLRAVVQDTESSLGSLHYRIGDKGALIGMLVAEETGERHRMAQSWAPRAASLDLAVPETLAALIAAWLDEAATLRRDHAVAGCELMLEATIDLATRAGMGNMLGAEDDFWTGLLRRSFGEDAALFGRAIAGYCRDELPFTLAASGHPDYRLLRTATITRLAARFRGPASGIAAHFEALVDRCGAPRDTAVLPVDLPQGSRKAELAGFAAALIAERGIAALSHRTVAARAGIANSNVAHYFRTHDDLLRGGMGALILGMRSELTPGAPQQRAARGDALLRATHSVALTALRDARLIPFALDMRRRRAENVRAEIGAAIGGTAGLDDAATQAVVVTLVGARLGTLAWGDDAPASIDIEQLARLHAGN